MILRSSVFVSDAGISEELRKQPVFGSSPLKCIRSFSARHSQVLEFNVPSNGAQQAVVVKHQPLDKSRHPASVEFDNLVKARRMLGEGLAESIPEPLLALSDAGILVTRKLPGTPLALLFKKYGNRLCGPFLAGRVAAKARLAGMWLRSFQEATQTEPIVFNPSCFLVDVEKRAPRLEDKGFEPKLARELVEKASIQGTRLRGRLVAAAARHGDFVPQNILIQQDRVGIVDFESFAERESVYYDPSMFLGYLLLLETRTLYHPGSIDRARVAFLSAFRDKANIDQELFSIYCLQCAIRVITDGPPLNRGWRTLGMIDKLSKRLKDLAAGSL